MQKILRIICFLVPVGLLGKDDPEKLLLLPIAAGILWSLWKILNAISLRWLFAASMDGNRKSQRVADALSVLVNKRNLIVRIHTNIRQGCLGFTLDGQEYLLVSANVLHHLSEAQLVALLAREALAMSGNKLTNNDGTVLGVAAGAIAALVSLPPHEAAVALACAACLSAVSSETALEDDQKATAIIPKKDLVSALAAAQVLATIESASDFQRLADRVRALESERG